MIRYIALWRYREKTHKLRITLPLDLNNLEYTRIYALMLSEGSFRNEFRLHAPEEVFHRILSSSLGNLLGKHVLRFMHKAKSRHIARTSFPNVARYLFPIPDHIPKFILQNKKFCREYLRIAFEAEGSPVNTESKRYVRLVRSSNVSDLARRLDVSVGEKVTFGKLKRKYPKIAGTVLDNPPSTLLGEHLMLIHHFNILNKIAPESIRRNKTTFRRDEFSAKWALHIYSEDLEKFGREIGFLSRNKKLRITKMLKVHGRKKKLSSFNNVIRNLQKDGFFCARDFVSEMRTMGYRSPRAYLSRYKQIGLIERIEHGVYRIKPRS
nr:type IV toxin-antitoxin system AbiEi family antitoxin domain-containing protein [Candidatus Njordarchaeota archaeon]